MDLDQIKHKKPEEKEKSTEKLDSTQNGSEQTVQTNESPENEDSANADATTEKPSENA